MRLLLALFLLLIIPIGQPLPAQPLPEEQLPVVLLEHSWQLEEEWTKIRKTKYSWRAKVKNNTSNRQKVSVCYTLVNEAGAPLARNMMSREVAPHQMLEITSDSYVVNWIIPHITASRAVIKSDVLRRKK